MPKIKRATILSVFIILGLIIGVIAYTVYGWVNADNIKTTEDTVIFIPTGSTYADVLAILDSAAILQSPSSFIRVAKWMKFSDSNVKSGKYTIKENWSNRQLVQMLRSGHQTPINLIVNNVRTIADAAGQIAQQIELDSLNLIRLFEDRSTLEKYQYTRENILSLLIPNTYELYWNISPNNLLERLKTEHDKFWQQKDRRAKAKELDLTESEVYTLASIVEKETQASSERPTVAGLYLNRLRRKMPLQADPTVVFATGLYDLRRVLLKHLEVESPYNTYKYNGLPPGPIYMPSIESLDAVLFADSHTYLYMCARPDNSGLHAFASTSQGHAQNATRYRRWLDQRGIR
jgi:UPF0755 protein